MEINFQNHQPEQKITKSGWFVFVILLASAILSFIAVGTSAKSDGLLKVYFLNVGQGDSEFIQAPNGNQVLIDGGPDGKVLQELGKIMPFYDHSIDLLVLSHPNTDHMNGLIEVLKKYEVDQIVENDVQYDTADHKEWNNLKTKARVTQARVGQVIDLGDGVKIGILFPFKSGSDKMNIKNVNDYMVISKLEYGSKSVLFTGDAEAKTEHQLVAGGSNVNAQFLKIGHHGSKTSTTEEFINSVKPLIAFIEVGAKNKFGHPHPSTLTRLENHGIKYYRTDIDGTVELSLDGQDYTIK